MTGLAGEQEVASSAPAIRVPEAHEEGVPPGTGTGPDQNRRPRWAYWLPLGVVLVGLLVTGALALISNGLYTNNEKKLLDLRARELGAVLTATLPNVQTPLASTAALADATNGDTKKFMALAALYAGAPPKHQFVSISLWRADSPQRGPIAVVGVKPKLSGPTVQAGTFLEAAARTRKLTVIGLLQQPSLRLGYAFSTPGPGSRFIAYGESALPTNRRSPIQSDSAFSELNYAIYLGPSVTPGTLLVTSLAHPPIQGRQAKATIPFGDTALTLVVAARHPLAGSLPERLPLIILLAGVILTLMAAALTGRLIDRRRAAERLALHLESAVGENQRLYAEQRTIAQTLQHALLPEELPQIPGTEASGQYVPGEHGVDIGGDWYDVIPLGRQRLLVAVGDVSGRGLRAAATMASLRYAIHAYAAQNDPPATILTKLSKLLHVDVDQQLATVLCAVIDLGELTLTITSAGHLPPLMLTDSGGEFIDGVVGPPIGVEDGFSYRSTTVSVPPSATFLAFTDGLVERRDEGLDISLARLRAAAAENHAGLTELLRELVSLRYEPADDDAAIVGIRWTLATTTPGAR